jgi:hypothetical protein
MPWSEEQARLMQEARLHIASPEAVYRELKEIANKPRVQLFGRKDEIEATLIERNEPLINLGLACFGTNEEVYKALYKHSVEPPRGATDAQYKRGLRIGCLSNKSVATAHLVSDFPRELIGENELNRILTAGDAAEVEALLCNPSVAENLLEELYTHTGAFAKIVEERWCRLVYLSRKNERIGTEEEYPDSPDTGHYAIHKAIFRLLEIAPLEMRWLRALYDLLGELNFMQTHTPQATEPVLTRWAQLDDKGSEGYFTSLSLKDEFRCLVASLYGRTYSNGRSDVQGSPTAKDVAMRCAYYGKALLTERELKAGYKRDEEVFVFAAMNNNNVLSKSALRKLFEKMVGGDMTRRYLRNFELKKKEWPHIESYFPREFREEIAPNKEDTRMENLTAAVTNIERRLNGFAEELKAARYWLIIAAVAIAAVFYFRH